MSDRFLCKLLLDYKKTLSQCVHKLQQGESFLFKSGSQWEQSDRLLRDGTFLVALAIAAFAVAKINPARQEADASCK